MNKILPTVLATLGTVSLVVGSVFYSSTLGNSLQCLINQSNLPSNASIHYYCSSFQPTLDIVLVVVGIVLLGLSLIAHLRSVNTETTK